MKQCIGILLLLALSRQSCDIFTKRPACLDQSLESCIWQQNACQQTTTQFCEDPISRYACLENQDYCIWEDNTCKNLGSPGQDYLTCDHPNISRGLCSTIPGNCAFTLRQETACTTNTNICTNQANQEDCVKSKGAGCIWKLQGGCVSSKGQQFECWQANQHACSAKKNLCYYDNGQCFDFDTSISCNLAVTKAQCKLLDCPCKICSKLQGKWQASKCQSVDIKVLIAEDSCNQGLNRQACMVSGGLCSFVEECSRVQVVSGLICYQLNRLACLGADACLWTGKTCVNDHCFSHYGDQYACLHDPLNLCMWDPSTRKCARSSLKTCSDKSLLLSRSACMNLDQPCSWNTDEATCEQSNKAEQCQNKNGYLNAQACRDALAPCKFLLGKCQPFDINQDTPNMAFNQAACQSPYRWSLGQCLSGPDPCSAISDCLQTDQLCYLQDTQCKSIPEELSKMSNTLQISRGTCIRLPGAWVWRESSCGNAPKDTSCSTAEILNYDACMKAKNACYWKDMECNEQKEPVSGCTLSQGLLNKIACLDDQSGKCLWDNVAHTCSETFTCSQGCDVVPTTSDQCVSNPFCVYDNASKQCTQPTVDQSAIGPIRNVILFPGIQQPGQTTIVLNETMAQLQKIGEYFNDHSSLMALTFLIIYTQ